ncbi:ABC-2 type transport system ATP-binding protein [Bacilli bacterium PM5-3]|nr:ABC-2 type transport system ATP-binding protein [Bacilli bacterium PM5-3]MDH6603877.1 ABC-2 type transport system ATP-binding protein [Bacilli bacterium PM5-9]
MEIIKCLNLSKSYGKKLALDNVNLSIKKGRIVGLLGANGSGKTTLLKLINDLLKPTTGSIKINNESPGINSKKIISYLPERTYLDLNMSVFECIEYFADFYQDFDKDKMYRMLEIMNIDTNAKMRTLSKGTKEKVQLALVMSREADVYILDEPIGGVDPAGRDFILQTILGNFNEDATLIISTHLISDIETILDEVIFINNGEILLHEDSDELRNKHNMSIDAIFREEFKC